MSRTVCIALIAVFLSFSAFGQVNWSDGVVYQYDGSGNVRKIGSDTYLYDTAQRLIRGSVAGSQQSYTYDSFGNRKACEAGGGDCQWGFPVDSSTNRVANLPYDPRGNMLRLPEGNTLEYDELGMVRQENGNGRKVYYIYTADDERIAVYDADTQLGTHQWQWTVRGIDKKPLREFTSEGTSGTTNFKWVKDHVWRDGALLASRQADASEPGGVSTYHYHVDHLGTPRRITNSASVIVGNHDYLPFGPELASTAINEPKLQDLKFTGHERDEVRDRPPLDYMHARYYEPRLGRFLSVDPVLGNPRSSQTWNRYAYVLNDPINGTDPDGRKAVPGSPLWGSDRCHILCTGDADGKPEGGRSHEAITVEAKDPGWLAALIFRTGMKLALGDRDFTEAEVAAMNGENHEATLLMLGWRPPPHLLGSPVFVGPLYTRTTYLYQKVGASGEHLKFGITANPATRYTAAELNGGHLRILAHGERPTMLRLERQLHETLPLGSEERQLFYIMKQLEKGLVPPPYK